jgi:hypothetical protein
MLRNVEAASALTRRESGVGAGLAGLDVAQTLLVAIRRYRAVVARLLCPSTARPTAAGGIRELDGTLAAARTGRHP